MISPASRKAFLLTSAALSALLIQGCGGKTNVAESSTKGVERNPLEITASADLMKDIQVGSPQWTQVAETLRVTGRIEADETRLVKVSVPLPGRITGLEVLEGHTVKKGQSLAGLYSTELSGSQLALIKALSQADLALRATERAKQLVSAGVIGTAEVQRREAELLQANAEVNSIRDQLRVLGLTEGEIQQLQSSRKVNSLTHVVSTIDGTVLDRKVNTGQIVHPSDVIFTIADLSNVWLVADIPEQNAGSIAVGRIVEAEVPALPGHTIRGRLSYISAIVDPSTRTVHVRMDVTNPKNRYKPAMLATIVLKDQGQRKRTLPLGAIVREQDRDYVYIQLADNKFVMRQVSLGEDNENFRVLNDGVSDTEKLVLEGAFHLNNERKRQALQKD